MENRKLKMENFIRWIEGFFLTVILCVAALRLSFIETPQNAMQNPGLWTTSRGISLILSSILFLIVLLGLLLRICKIRWHSSCWAIVLGLILFAAAALLAIFPASDKRAAETECITLVVPMLMALTLYRWLDSARRMDIVIWVILSIGCAAVYMNIDQSMESNQQVLDDYRKNPAQQLAMLGIEPNSLAQFQYEHRLMSQDVRGFLTTSNSTGSFLLIGIFITIGLLTDTLRSEKKDEGFTARLIIQFLILLALIVGLFIGKSRGAITAAGLILLLFAVLLFYGKWIWQNRLPNLIFAAIISAVICAAAVYYGLGHGRLPGPNAMFVRWQYWVSSIQMAADHPLLGVGGGNFATYYTQYKIPAAPETVQDPHNFVLSLLCQFGPLSVAGFVILVFAIVWRGLKTALDSQNDLAMTQDIATLFSKDRIFPFGAMVGVTFTLLYFRPIVIDGGVPGETALIRQSVFVVLYLIPVFFFLFAYGLLWATSPKLNDQSPRKGLILGLICSAAAVLIHNLIDFALFEPGIWTTFWMILAMILALGVPKTAVQTQSAQCGRGRGVMLMAIILAVGVVFFVRVYKPIAAGRQMQSGLKNYENAQDYFEAGAKIDPLDPDYYFIAAQWNLRQFNTLRLKHAKFLDKALDFVGRAQQNDPQHFRYPKTISDIFSLKSEMESDKQKEHLDSAYKSLFYAQQLYPGSDEIAYHLGQLAEKLDQLKKAAEHYRKAVEIEDQYRIQFIQMYPNTPLFSRLGQKKYDYAKDFLRKYADSK